MKVAVYGTKYIGAIAMLENNTSVILEVSEKLISRTVQYPLLRKILGPCM